MVSQEAVNPLFLTQAQIKGIDTYHLLRQNMTSLPAFNSKIKTSRQEELFPTDTVVTH